MVIYICEQKKQKKSAIACYAPAEALGVVSYRKLRAESPTAILPCNISCCRTFSPLILEVRYTQGCAPFQGACPGLISDGTYSPFRPFRAFKNLALSAIIITVSAVMNTSIQGIFQISFVANTAKLLKIQSF